MILLKTLLVAGVLTGAGLVPWPSGRPAAAPPAGADWKAAFRDAYGLAPGQAVRRIPRPYPPARAAFAAANKLDFRASDGRSRPVGDETVLGVYWLDDQAHVFLNARQVGDNAVNRGTELRAALVLMCNVADHEIETVGTVAEQRTRDHLRLTGDFAYDPGATLTAKVADLDRIARDGCGLPVRLRAVKRDRPVLVAAGRFAADQPVEVHGREKPAGGTTEQSGTLADFLRKLADRVRLRVADAVEGPRPELVRWRVSNGPTRTRESDGFRWSSDDADRDPVEVAATVAAQTGLAVRVERRAVDVVLVEPDN